MDKVGTMVLFEALLQNTAEFKVMQTQRKMTDSRNHWDCHPSGRRVLS